MTTSNIPTKDFTEQIQNALEHARSREGAAAMKSKAEEIVSVHAFALDLPKEQVREALAWDWSGVQSNAFRLAAAVQHHLVARWNSQNEHATEEFRNDCLRDMPKIQKDVELYTKLFVIANIKMASTFTADAYGVMIHLLSYNMASQQVLASGDVDPDNRAEARKRFDKVMNFFREDDAVVLSKSIADAYLSREEVQEYEDFRWDHWTETANVIRTYISDEVAGESRPSHTGSERYKRDFKEACIWLSMFEENCDFTLYGILAAMKGTYRYVANNQGKSPELEEAQVLKLVDWLTDARKKGDFIRAEMKRQYAADLAIANA